MTPDEVLSQYPGPVTLYEPVSGALMLSLLALPCCAYVVYEGTTTILKIAGLGIGGLFMLDVRVQYIRPSRIELTAWGFSIKDYGGDTTTCAWRAASEFRAVWISRSHCVQYADRNFENSFFGSLRSVPRFHPFRTDQMVELMNAWRNRALGISEQP
jgi:hypothetical protein